MPSDLSQFLPVSLPRRQIDPDALSVCRRLQEAGHTTYLVGGCVRDIILGRQPKDFDIGTFATPQQVRKLFRNSRIIGRRFRLVHIVFGPKIFEVATFRGGEQDEDKAPAGDGDDRLIRRANNFGTPEEDAVSRDFTMNALFYDPVAERVIDHVRGYGDLREGIVRTIGAPDRRFQEDPVRILRAIKFAARLGFSIASGTLAAIPDAAADILRCPVPRVTEEIYRLAESGYAAGAVELMADNGVLEVVLPEIAAYREQNTDDYTRHMRGLDRLVRAHGGLPREFVLALLYYPLALQVVAEAGLEPGPGWGRLVEEWFRPIGVRMHLAIKHRTRMRSLVAMMGRRFLASPSKRRKSRLGTNERVILPQALTLVRHHHHVYGGLEEAYERWRLAAVETATPWVPVTEAPREGGASKDARPRRRRRRRRPDTED